MTLYEFETIDGKDLFTFYSPKEIAEFLMFDSYDEAGESVVVEKEQVNFKSFEALR